MQCACGCVVLWVVKRVWPPGFRAFGLLGGRWRGVGRFFAPRIEKEGDGRLGVVYNIVTTQVIPLQGNRPHGQYRS